MKFKAIIITLTICLSCIGHLFAQTSSTRENLTNILCRISVKYDVRMSFDPSLTDNVYPKNTQIVNNISEVLTNVLKGTGFSFKEVNDKYFYIFKVDAGAQAIVTPTLPTSQPTPEQRSDIVKDEPLCATLAVKSNLLYDATTSMNLGVEVGLAPRWTLDISGNYNPWTFADNHKMKHWLIQPEARYWLCQRFNGHFFGLHAHYAQFNVGGMLPWGFNSGKMFGVIESDAIMNHRYEGWLAGAGISYGYYWILGNRWGLEATIGGGYAYLAYDKYRCEKCGEKLGSDNKHYFGPTKAGITLVFMIK